LQVPSTRPRRGRCSLPGCWGQHYQASARAALPLGDTHQHRRGSSILQDPASNTTRRAAALPGCWHNTANTAADPGLLPGILAAAARAALPSSNQGRHTPAPPRLQDPTRATPTRRAAVPGHPCSLDSWAGSLDNSNQGAGCSLVAGNSITNFVISVGLI